MKFELRSTTAVSNTSSTKAELSPPGVPDSAIASTRWSSVSLNVNSTVSLAKKVAPSRGTALSLDAFAKKKLLNFTKLLGVASIVSLNVTRSIPSA